MKEIPDDFYEPYFELAKAENISNSEKLQKGLKDLEIIRTDDSPEEAKYFTKLFSEMLSLFSKPFNSEVFDFSDDSFFAAIAALGEKYAKSTELRKMNGNRGSKHFLYINRTFFGLYNLLHELKAEVSINSFQQYLEPA
jgi:hypothetical protein